MRRPVDSFTRITSVHGQVTSIGKFGKHLGVDYGMPEGGVVRAPVSAKVTFSGTSATLGNYYELVEDGNGRIHRLCHLSRRSVGAGAHVAEGQDIGRSGNTGITTGPHLHWDVRKAGTKWDESFYNYFDPEALLAAQPGPMPPVGSSVQLMPTQVRTTFRAGSTTIAGSIKVTNDTFVYKVRGYDTKFPNRIIINSKSGGGDGVALALYYVNGTKIEGWRQV